MGICESNNKNNNKFDNVPSVTHIQLNENTPNNAYKYDFDNIKNSFTNINNKTYNLKFTFTNFKIKYCVSHKTERNSFYITEISLGEKAFPLVINNGQSPNIPNLKDSEGYFIEKEFKFDELERTYLFINIYEYTEEMPSLNMSLSSLPNELKSRAKYNSYFRINFASFLFKSSKCEFPLMGNNQLSKKTRIGFNCFIEHKEKIKIEAKCTNSMKPYITKLILEYKDEIIISDTRSSDGSFSLTTPPMSMNDLQNSDIYFETNEDENYSYFSLNYLKYQIIVSLGKKVITYSDMKEINLHTPLDMNVPVNSLKNSSIFDRIFGPSYQTTNNNDYYYRNNMYNNDQSQNQNQNIFQDFEAGANKDAELRFYNIPLFSQIHNLYFTEYGIVFNTSFLNIINDDQDLDKYRKNKQISADDFRDKLNKYYQELNVPNYKMSVLNDIQILLSRSIDTDKFMFIYPTFESLTLMVFLMMNLGITIINYINNSKEEYEIIQLTKIINTLVKREELDNSVIYFILDKYPKHDNSPIILYNKFYSSLYQLYLFLITNKAPQNADDILIELFSRLYYKKKYFRRIMLSTLSGEILLFNENNIDDEYDRFLFDEIYDEKLNQFLYGETIQIFKQFTEKEDFLKNIPYDKFKLFKRIIATLNELAIYKYPLEFYIFNNIRNIVSILIKEINSLKIENINKPPLGHEFYEMLMLFSCSYYSITNINDALIQSTNVHNQYAIYTLYIYFKSLLEYHYSLANSKLLFDYACLEKASEILVKDEDSVSIPRLFWFYYSCYNLVLSGNLKCFVAQIVNKNFEKLAYHWSFTIRQVYFKFLIYVINDKLKDKEGIIFNQQKLNPFRSRNLNNYHQMPYISEAMKDYDLISKEYNIWASTSRSLDADLPVYSLPPPMLNVVGGLD